MNGKLLLISWTLYPWTSGSAVIVNNLASCFGKDQMVLLGERPVDRPIDGWPESNPEIHYLDPNRSIAGRGMRYLRWMNFSASLRKAGRLIEEQEVDKILVVFPDDFYLMLAYQLSRRYDLPLFTWFHNTYLDNYSGPRKLLAKWLQPSVWKRAKHNFVMSDGMLRFYEQQYPDFNFTTLRHGFPLRFPAFKPATLAGSRLRFVFTGSLNESCEDAALRLMRHVLGRPEAELHVYTGNPESYFSSRGLTGDRFFYHGFIDLADLYAALGDYDIMLLPHGFDGKRTEVEFRTIFPTRTIPLLLSNRPILAHSPPDVFLTDFLREQDCALIVDNTEEASIDAAIRQLQENPALRARLVRHALEAATQFDVQRIAQQLKERIDSYAA